MSGAIAIEAAATYEGGKPLEVLGQLLKQREQLLGESSKDACVATGIIALRALRAQTKTAPKRIPKADIRWGNSDPRYITSTKGKTAGKLLRRTVVSRYRNGQKVNLVKWQVVEGEAKTRRASAADLSAAWRRYGAINRRGLAKTALGIAMGKLGTWKAPTISNRKINDSAAANVAVRETSSGQTFTLEITDALRYAQDALKGGAAAIDLALKKASNHIAGRLSRVAAAKLGAKIPTPFPEVKGRRVA